jgi:hypothetical protein
VIVFQGCGDGIANKRILEVYYLNPIIKVACEFEEEYIYLNLKLCK